jgi:hypothetical protein
MSRKDAPDRGAAWHGERGMKSFVYGIVFGAAMAYLYATQGPLIEATFGSALSWRDSAKTSVNGYGGPQAKR